MDNIVNNMKKITGIGLTLQDSYNRIFEKEVSSGNFGAAVKDFKRVVTRAKAKDPKLANQAEANAKLYQYLDKHMSNASLIAPLLQKLRNLEAEGIKQIEEIGTSSMSPVSTAPLVAELECRLVEFQIDNAQDDITKKRDLHKDASDKFQKINSDLITYRYIPANKGPNDKARNRHLYHSGMYHYYDAWIQKDVNMSAATASLAEAETSFKQYNAPQWLPHVSKLLNNWIQTRTCWICDREIQGYELNFFMYPAKVTPYFQKLLVQEKKNIASFNAHSQQIAVCNVCSSMIEFKAQEEANKVNQKLNLKFEETMKKTQSLESQVSDLQWRVSGLESQVSGLQWQASGLESQVSTLASDLESQMSGLEKQASDLETRVNHLEEYFSQIE